MSSSKHQFFYFSCTIKLKSLNSPCLCLGQAFNSFHSTLFFSKDGLLSNCSYCNQYEYYFYLISLVYVNDTENLTDLCVACPYWQKFKYLYLFAPSKQLSSSRWPDGLQEVLYIQRTSIKTQPGSQLIFCDCAGSTVTCILIVILTCFYFLHFLQPSSFQLHD